MREVYGPYAYDQLTYAKEVLKTAPAGVSSISIDELKKRKQADIAAKKDKDLVTNDIWHNIHT